MFKFLSFVSVLFFVALVCGAASGATYYVSTTGDNADDGSVGTPWATLQYAVDTISAGDTILVQPGTYAGCRIELSGTSVAPKTLQANGAVLLNSLSGEARHSGVLEIENYDAAVEYWVIDGFECDGVSGSYRPIDCRNADGQENTHITITNCEAHDGVSTGIFAAYTDYVLIEDNVSYDNGEHGFYVNNSSDNGTVRGNESYGNVANGIHMNGDTSQAGDGMLSYWLVEDNVCHSNPSTGINCDGVDNSMYRNNLIYEFGNKGMTFYGIDGEDTSHDNAILNNTVLSDSGGLIGYYDIFIHRNRRQKGDPTGHTIYNNILYNYRTATNRGSICVHDSAFSDFDSDYNVVMEYFGIDDNKDVLDFSEWQALGYDTNSVQASDTALFIDPANHDYTLANNSPAIDAGTTLNDVTDDILGVSRPQNNAYDIGCYED